MEALTESQMHHVASASEDNMARLQVIAELDRSPFSELRSYTATDITPAFGPNLLQLVNNSKLEFKVNSADHSKLLICSARTL